MKKHLLGIVIEQDKDGFFAYCPFLQGCYTQGDTYEEALSNIRDAIRLHLADRKAAREPVQYPEAISITTVQVAG